MLSSTDPQRAVTVTFSDCSRSSSRIDGHGKEQFADGSEYIGNYQAGEKSGQGVFRWPDGSSYTGQFLRNAIHGHGEYHFADGRRFVGEFSRNSMEGEGCFHWPDGRKFAGGYISNKKEGFGVFRWADGRLHSGMWSAGVQHGEGIFTTSKGQSRKGVWREGSFVHWLGSAFVSWEDYPQVENDNNMRNPVEALEEEKLAATTSDSDAAATGCSCSYINHSSYDHGGGNATESRKEDDVDFKSVQENKADDKVQSSGSLNGKEERIVMNKKKVGGSNDPHDRKHKCCHQKCIIS